MSASTSPTSDEQRIAREFLVRNGSHVNPFSVRLLCPLVRRAREIEPRINTGAHLEDFANICDDDDDFDSFYGSDYFKR